MTTLFYLIKNFIKLNFYKKSRIFTFFLLPSLVMAVLASVGASDMDINVGVIDNDNGVLASELIRKVSEINNHEITMLKPDVDENELLINKKYDLIISIPESMTSNIVQGIKPVVDIVTIKGHLSIWVDLEVRNFLGICSSLSQKNVTETGILGVLNDINNSGYDIYIKEDMFSSELAERLIGLLLAFLFVQAMSVTRLILKDKEDGTYYRIRTTLVSEFTYTMGNLISALILLSIQILLTLSIVVGVLKIDLYVSFSQLYLLLMLFGFGSVAIGLFIIGIANSHQQASNISTLILTPTCMLGGCYWPITIMPGFMQKLAWFTPQYWTMAAFKAIGSNLAPVAINLLVIGGMGVIFTMLYWLIVKNTHKVEDFI